MMMQKNGLLKENSLSSAGLLWVNGIDDTFLYAYKVVMFL
jgi:hypothetical protein